jgi:hypothetical protein
MGEVLDLLNAHLAREAASRRAEVTPPLDAEGVPCGGCPSCGQGEFWRWPRFHKDHDPRGWICWFCSPPPPYSGPCDFCGVPEN